jgi:hypothetical protein
MVEAKQVWILYSSTNRDIVVSNSNSKDKLSTFMRPKASYAHVSSWRVKVYKGHPRRLLDGGGFNLFSNGAVLPILTQGDICAGKRFIPERSQMSRTNIEWQRVVPDVYLAAQIRTETTF